jgi:hypothetical protein
MSHPGAYFCFTCWATPSCVYLKKKQQKLTRGLQYQFQTKKNFAHSNSQLLYFRNHFFLGFKMSKDSEVFHETKNCVVKFENIWTFDFFINLYLKKIRT